MTPDDTRLVVEVIDLPWVSINTYTDKREGVAYAAVLGGAKASLQNWCHDPDATDPPYFFHRTEAEAWECFDKHHPGLRAAIEAVTEELEL